MIEAEHVAYEPGVTFADRMNRGPFARWLHRHTVAARGANECELIVSCTGPIASHYECRST